VLDPFREAYAKLFKIKAHAPWVRIIALTATAPPHLRLSIMSLLGMIVENTEWVNLPFQRPNLFFTLVIREDLVLPHISHLRALINDVREYNVQCTRTIIFTPSLTLCSSIYAYMRNSLGKDMFVNGRIDDASSALCNMFHSRTDKDSKAVMLKQFLDPKSCLRVIIATSALAFGVNIADVRRVIHIDVPRCLSDYMQQSGRAGRELTHAELECLIVLITTAASIKASDEHMRAYCAEGCLRAHMSTFLKDPFHAQQDGRRCCSVCNPDKPESPRSFDECD
jgi:ATP-dependent DNA helicase RecQ